ncbi:phage integrase SAM-like domain-containing protein [Sphingobacterium sp. Mn56C]|uniref:phage integrase SAM-like domain-containing protein n=1 Tax=Sphingobacterium sp. Mn56C TaxID=3395261 RepID=UPI003BE9BB51
MKTNFSMLFYMKRQKNYQSGEAPIYLRITVAGKRTEISTGCKCLPNRWNVKSGRQIGTKEDVKHFNKALDDMKAKVYEAYRTLSNKKTKITTESLKTAFLGKDIVTHSLMEVIKLHNDKIRALIGIEYASGTLKRFLVLERHVQAFLLAKFNYTDIDIKDVDQSFISDFELYLRTENSCANNTAVKYLKNLSKIIRIALSMDWIDKDPMFGYKMRTKPVERPFLSEEELSTIVTKEFATERLSQVRDIFIFCCFTGLAYSDVEKLKVTDVFKGIDGTDWLSINRTKTGTLST